MRQQWFNRKVMREALNDIMEDHDGGEWTAETIETILEDFADALMANTGVNFDLDVEVTNLTGMV